MAINIDLNRTLQDIDWLKEKLYLNTKAQSAKNRKVWRGEVYNCKLGLGIGSEECKERPCVILQYDSANKKSPNTIVAPITHTNSNLEVVIPIQDKENESGQVILDGYVLLGNIVCVSKARLGDFVATLTNNEMRQIDEAISISLGIKHYYQSLLNEYDDKLEYIQKLIRKREELSQALEEKERIITEITNSLDQCNDNAIEVVRRILEKYKCKDDKR